MYSYKFIHIRAGIVQSALRIIDAAGKINVPLSITYFHVVFLLYPFEMKLETLLVTMPNKVICYQTVFGLIKVLRQFCQG